jgi:8-amino-7-oxononanoate synthase
METKYSYFEKALQKRIEQERYRQMRCVMPIDESHLMAKDGHVVNFGSSDFLGLSQNSFVKKKTIQYVLEWGAGSTASRLLIGHLECQKLLEEKIAKRIGFESALLFSSPIQACSTITSAVLNPRAALFVDSGCHMGLVQAALAGGVKPIYYAHGDIDDLVEKMDVDAPVKMVLTESLSEVDGTRANLERLIAVTKERGALLFVDDSQTFGVLGESGMGLGISHPEIDFVVSAFGKACGSFGAFVACNQLMRNYISHFAEGISPANPLPPAALGAIEAAIDLIPDMQAERDLIAVNSAFLREQLTAHGWEIGKAADHILPIFVAEEDLFDLSEHLSAEGILTTLVKPKKGPMRLKIAINATHTRQDIEALVEVLGGFLVHV